jgi:hypothetical protein
MGSKDSQRAASGLLRSSWLLAQLCASRQPIYVATEWKFLLLVDLEVTAKNDRMINTCELLGEHYLENEENYLLCTTANITRALIDAGYDKHDRIRRASDWLVNEQREDGGWHCFPSKAGTLDCWEPLRVYAALP